jgi:single-stranded-DNA-specific exonuclease
MHAHKIISIAHRNEALQKIFAQELGISPITAGVLVNRGIRTVQEANRFLEATFEHLYDPLTLEGVKDAVLRIKKAAQHKERIMLVGDYDVDGVTSAVMLKNSLKRLGVEANHYLPHRVNEGYGLNKNMLLRAKEERIQLMITADCGTNNDSEIAELRKNHIDVIVTDHHEPLSGKDLSPASIVVNPKLAGSSYRFRDLAGVGVVYKLCQALTEDALCDDLDIVALGTIADVVPLRDENRIIAKEGLSRITSTKKLGLQELLKSSGIEKRKIDSTAVGFILGPRLNASGRVDSPEIAFQLLTTQKQVEAAHLASILETCNRKRQKIESDILEEAEALINKEINFKEHKVIVLAKEDWHPGVLGIVASKLADRFYRPVIIISLTQDECRGSGRSIKDFHLFDALTACKDYLKTFGGHSHAAGLVVARERIDDFKREFNAVASKNLKIEHLLPTIEVDREVAFSEWDERIIRELESLEPFGTGNPQPSFFARNVRLKGVPARLNKNTLKCWLSDGTATYQAIGFGMGDFKDSLMQVEGFNLVYTPRLDRWQGNESVLLEMRDIFFA